MIACATESGARTGARAVKDIEPKAVETYSTAILQAPYDRPLGEPLLWAVERRLHVLAAKGKGGSSAKMLV